MTGKTARAECRAFVERSGPKAMVVSISGEESVLGRAGVIRGVGQEENLASVSQFPLSPSPPWPLGG